jgi:hypothetical protein
VAQFRAQVDDAQSMAWLEENAEDQRNRIGALLRVDVQKDADAAIARAAQVLASMETSVTKESPLGIEIRGSIVVL